MEDLYFIDDLTSGLLAFNLLKDFIVISAAATWTVFNKIYDSM